MREKRTEPVYETERAMVDRFIADRCVLDTWRKVDARDLYEAFKAWADDEGVEAPASPSMVGRTLRDRGFGKRKSNGAVLWLGLDIAAGTKRRGA